MIDCLMVYFLSFMQLFSLFSVNNPLINKAFSELTVIKVSAMRIRPTGIGLLLKDLRVNYWQEYRKVPSMQELISIAESRHGKRSRF